MLEGLRHLLGLQRLDDDLIAREAEHAAIPDARERIAATRLAEEESLAAARQGLQEAEAGQRRAEQDLQDQEALLRKLEGQQFQVKSNEAYSALLHEMEAAKQAISDCETRILESMESIESARAVLEGAEKEARETKARLDGEERALDAREQELAGQIEKLRAERTEAAAGIPAPLLGQYERIGKRRRPVVVTIRKEMCEGCRVGIPPQSYIELLRGESMVSCGNCQRILVHEERLQALAAG